MPAHQWLWLLPAVPVISAATADLAARRGWRRLLVFATAGYSVLTWLAVMFVTYASGFRGPLEPLFLTLFVALLCWLSLFLRWRPDKPKDATP